jgi:large subunit ribosomal protein L18
MIYKRKKLGKTDYRSRLEHLKSNLPRLIIRRSLKNLWSQITEYTPKGDKILVSAHTKELIKNFKWKAKRNTPTAYLLGLIIGKKANEKNIKKVILDVGLKKPVKGSVTYGFLKGVVDSGLDIPHSKEVFPSEDRISGKHIKDFDAKLFEEVKKKVSNAR